MCDIEERIANIEESVDELTKKTNKFLNKINQKLNFKCFCKLENLFSYCWMIFFNILAHVAIVKYQITFFTVVFIALIPVLPIFFSYVNYGNCDDENEANGVSDNKSKNENIYSQVLPQIIKEIIEVKDYTTNINAIAENQKQQTDAIKSLEEKIKTLISANDSVLKLAKESKPRKFDWHPVVSYVSSVLFVALSFVSIKHQCCSLWQYFFIGMVPVGSIIVNSFH